MTFPRSYSVVKVAAFLSRNASNESKESQEDILNNN